MPANATKNYFKNLITSDQFYFQKGKDALQEWMDIILSNEGQIELRDLLDDYSSFTELRKDHKFFSVKEILFRIVSYCDIHARKKAFYNQYEDKRVLAKAGVRMKPWIINIFNYKYKKGEINITVKNALNMLINPQDNINSIALSHRELISRYYLGHTYETNTFVSELKDKFSHLDRTKNSANQTLLIAAHIYDEKKEWDKKQMDFKTFVNNLKDYVLKNQLDYSFGKFRGRQQHVWIFDKEENFNHVRAHYEIIMQEGIISVDLHFEDGKENSELMNDLLGDLPEFLELKQWHAGNSVSHKNKYKIVDEDLVENVMNDLDELFEFTSEKLIKKIKEMNSEGKNKNEKDKISYPLNQILYGPPGTGKTYHTVNRALEIIENKYPDEIKKEDREDLKKRFDDYLKSGQIVFTTFHQSMSYEDFIEGIKPQIVEDEEDGKRVIYEIKNGIFKNTVKKAKDYKIEEVAIKPYSFDDAWSDLIIDANNHLEKKDPLFLSIQTPKLGLKIVDISDQGNLKLKPIYSEDSKVYTVSYSRSEKLQKSFPHLSAIKNIDKEFREIIGGSNSTAYWSVLNYINAKINEKAKIVGYNEKQEVKPYIIIIDEINRGNISQIFGELITLIEEDKRLGAKEALEITLPYSKEKFGVPSNLYIIGTMNTADRSVEALDTALRRRFVFEEMAPKYEELEKLRYDLYGFQAYEILKTINRRIEKLIDKDHAIGHAYFLNKNNEMIIDSFYKNIIPLLQEYFFGDYGKIGLVLGRGFVKLKDNKSSVFAKFDYEGEEYNDREIFEIIDYRNSMPDYIIEGHKMDFNNAIQLLMN